MCQLCIRCQSDAWCCEECEDETEMTKPFESLTDNNNNGIPPEIVVCPVCSKQTNDPCLLQAMCDNYACPMDQYKHVNQILFN